MRYNHYTATASTIIAEVCDVAEVACPTCAATWLVGCAPPSCPYCGTLALSEAAATLAEQSGRAASYARDVRGIARALWNGSFDYDQAFGFMWEIIPIGLTTAWHAGARECGILPADMSPDEKQALATAIRAERGYINGFLAFVDEHSKANGGKFATVKARADLWGYRYIDVQNRARLMACADQRLEWVWTPEKEHCVDCGRLNGKTKRASYWARFDIRPQSPRLACKGFQCGCNLVPTDKPLSRGPLPRLSGG